MGNNSSCIHYIKRFLSVDFSMELVASFKLTVPSWLTGITEDESSVVLTYFPIGISNRLSYRGINKISCFALIVGETLLFACEIQLFFVLLY